MSSIEEIRNQVFSKVEPQRLVLKLRTSQLDSADYRTSACNYVNEIFPDWENDDRVRFLAIEIREDRVFMAVDVNNFAYDFATAHKDETIVPVYVLRHSRRRGWFNIRWPQEDARTAWQIAHLHEVNGYDATLPFFADFNEPFCYANPRKLADSRRENPRPTVPT